MPHYAPLQQRTAADPPSGRIAERSPPSEATAAGLGGILNGGPGVSAQLQLSAALHRSPAMVAQRRLAATLQRAEIDDDEPVQRQEANRTGLPDHLKAGVESLSGLAMDDVRVHYNSPEPRQLQALAFAQGTDIHVAPGQEQHLPHEAWHVVQQQQGRVQPTMQAAGVAINDDDALEREADAMGARAVQMMRDGTTDAVEDMD